MASNIGGPVRCRASTGSAKQMALGLPKNAWRKVTWREGTNTKLASRFAAVRAPLVHRDYQCNTPRPEEWCLIEWPTGDAEPIRKINARKTLAPQKPVYSDAKPLVF